MNNIPAYHLEDDDIEAWSCADEPFLPGSRTLRDTLARRGEHEGFQEVHPKWVLRHAYDVFDLDPEYEKQFDLDTAQDKTLRWRDELVRSLASAHEITNQFYSVIRNRLVLSSVQEEARRLLLLENDWDGYDSPAFEESTITSVIDFIARLASSAEKDAVILPKPDINPADEGSIDLAWRLKNGMLLINIPAQQEHDITFFGESATLGTTAGEIERDSLRADLVAWLYQLDQ